MRTKLRVRKKLPEKTGISIDDDERHAGDVDGYVARNRKALNASIGRSRKEIAKGKFSTKSIGDIVAEGKARFSKSR